jgi:DNA (cytosine-5)-methyltransferase 1
MGLVVDNFAGGGGASTGIELAMGRSVDIAINHDPEAIRMHKTNHPNTKHYCEDVWQVDPVAACEGQEVDAAWFSPDCKHFSRAKGKAPANKKIRGLAWVALRWAGLVRPKVIFLENVAEFQTWGPVSKGKPVKKKAGQTFNKFINQLKDLGYEVQYRELAACDYGAPTTRKRFFLIARCDGQPIVWPEPTHANPVQIEVLFGIKKPYLSVASIIDWTLPTKSIFNRNKPLADATMVRVARGIQKFVIDEEPYVLHDKAYFLSHYYGTQGKETRGSSLNSPLATITASPRFGLVSVTLGDVKLPIKDGVMAFLTKYYKSDIGQSLNMPLHTITTKPRFGLITVHGKDYKIVDVGLRMLTARELYRAQGFPNNYIIDHDYTGAIYPYHEQVARCGNAVVPKLAEVLVKANLHDLIDAIRIAV